MGEDHQILLRMHGQEAQTNQSPTSNLIMGQDNRVHGPGVWYHPLTKLERPYLVHKDSSEYILWAHFSPETGKAIIYVSDKHIPSVNEFTQDLLKKSSMVPVEQGRKREKSAAHRNREGRELPDVDTLITRQYVQIPLHYRHGCEDLALGDPERTVAKRCQSDWLLESYNNDRCL